MKIIPMKLGTSDTLFETGDVRPIIAAKDAKLLADCVATYIKAVKSETEREETEENILRLEKIAKQIYMALPNVTRDYETGKITLDI